MAPEIDFNHLPSSGMSEDDNAKAKKCLSETCEYFAGVSFPESEADIYFNRLLKRLRHGVKFAEDFTAHRLAALLIATGRIHHPALLSQAEASDKTKTWKKMEKLFPSVGKECYDKVLDTAAAALTKLAGHEVTKSMVECTMCEGIRFQDNKNKWDHRFPGQNLYALRRDDKRQLVLLRLSPDGETSLVWPIAYGHSSLNGTASPGVYLDICCKNSTRPPSKGKYNIFEFHSPEQSRLFMQHIRAMNSDEQAQEFAKLVICKKNKKKAAAMDWAKAPYHWTIFFT